jgi:REP element-mobilizing transposase RayT
VDNQNQTGKKRKVIRLQDFDYSQNGAYFVTTVVKHRLHLFGQVINGQMKLNDAGKMVQDVCRKMPIHHPGIEFSPFQIMPNHFHTIILVRRESGRPQWGAPTEDPVDLIDIVGRFKSLTTNFYIEGTQKYHWLRFDQHLWQRSFYEHVIRNERDFQAISEYIEANPLNWSQDSENLY